MPIINITVAGKIATNTTPGEVIVCGNSDYSVNFALDSEWDAEPNRTARFVYYKNGLRLYKDKEFTGDTVAVPVLSNIDYVEVGVYAGDLRTTTPARVLCDRSILCGDPLEDLGPEERAKLQAQIGDLSQLQTPDKSNLVAAINAVAQSGSGLSDSARALLATILRAAVYTNDQSANITALEAALASGSGGGEVPDIPDEPDVPINPEVTLAGITATYSGGDVAIGTALNNLTGVVVKAVYSDGSTATVTDYTLTGEIAEGSNTITVSYSGKTTTFAVTGVAESGGETDIHDGYIPDGLEFRLDGIRNTPEGHDNTIDYKVWNDVSGNGYTTTTPNSAGGQILDNCYTSILASGEVSRCQRAVSNAIDLLSKLANYTVEVVWKGAQDNSYSTSAPVARFGHNKGGWFIAANGQTAVEGNQALHGSAVSYDENIKHWAVTYDGTNLILYHEGVQDITMAADIDITDDTELEFFGDGVWSQLANGYFYAARVYTRALSAEEIKANYDNDIARFGAVGVEVS